MRHTNKLAVMAATALIVGTTFVSSAFADSRLRDETTRGDRGSYENRDRDSRDNERVTVEGRISNMTRERDGYRVQLERSGYSFWVPERSVRARDFRIGVSIRLGGIFRRGAVYVDVVDYPRGGGYYDDDRYDRGVQGVYVKGVVQDIDHRRGLLYVRDDYSRRVITVDAYRLERESRRFDLEDLRRGELVEVHGAWGAHGVLQAYRIESLRDRYRY